MKYTDWQAFAQYLHVETPFPSICMIYSKEPFVRQMAQEAVLQAAKRKKTLVRWEESETSESRLQQEVCSLDLFSSSKIIYFACGEKLSKGVIEAMIHCLPRITSQHAFLIVAETSTALSALCKAADKYGVLFAPEALRAKDLDALCLQWLQEKAYQEGATFSGGALQLLYQSIGPNYHDLYNEFTKLVTYADVDKTISETAIIDLVQAIPQASGWQLLDFLLQGDIRQALHIGNQLLLGGTALIALLRLIRKSFETTCDLCSLLYHSVSMDEIARRFPTLKGFILEKNIQYARRYGLKRYQQGLILLDQAELAAKDHRMSEELILEKFITQWTLGIFN